MPNYRRTFTAGGTFFFTVVSYQRRPIFTSEKARSILHDAWQAVQERLPFTNVAICLLPNHIHTIWTLPEGDGDTSLRWKEIKRLFTRTYLAEIGPGPARSASRLQRGEATLWQRRFWEHIIYDEIDFNRHMDYVHYNPVKHGFANSPRDWPWSSFHRYVEVGYYPPDWASGDQPDIDPSMFGE